MRTCCRWIERDDAGRPRCEHGWAKPDGVKWRCPEKRKRSYALYEQSEAARARKARYNRSEKGIARYARYSRSESARAYKAEWNGSEAGRSSKRLYELTRTRVGY